MIFYNANNNQSFRFYTLTLLFEFSLIIKQRKSDSFNAQYSHSLLNCNNSRSLERLTGSEINFPPTIFNSLSNTRAVGILQELLQVALQRNFFYSPQCQMLCLESMAAVYRLHSISVLTFEQFSIRITHRGPHRLWQNRFKKNYIHAMCRSNWLYEYDLKFYIMVIMWKSLEIF